MKFILFVLALLCGCGFFDLYPQIPILSYIDELIVVFFLLNVFSTKRVSDTSGKLWISIVVFFLYFIYSLIWGVNSWRAALIDLIIQLKPYVIFYCALITGYNISEQQKKKIIKLVLAIALIMLPYGFVYAYTADGDAFIHPSRYATMYEMLTLTFLYCVKGQYRERLMAFAIVCIGLLSFRAKIIGFIVVFFYILFVQKRKVRLNFKYLFVGCFLVLAVIYVAREKIFLYFISGSQGEVVFARTALYQGAFEILKDYVPFGSGLGSFATYASGLYFSPLYYTMPLLRASELSDGKFISDTFYPSLAQFGIIGVWLYIMFWVNSLKRVSRIYCYGDLNIEYKSALLIVLFFVIEGVADSTFTQNRGVFLMLLFAMFINKGLIKSKECQLKNNKR